MSLTPEEIWRLRLAGRAFAACLKFWGAVVWAIFGALVSAYAAPLFQKLLEWFGWRGS